MIALFISNLFVLSGWSSDAVQTLYFISRSCHKPLSSGFTLLRTLAHFFLALPEEVRSTPWCMWTEHEPQVVHADCPSHLAPEALSFQVKPARLESFSRGA